MLISSIPMKLKSILRTHEVTSIKSNNDIPKVLVKGQLRDLTKLNNQVLYWVTVNEPACISGWHESYPFLEVACWEKIFRVVYFFIKEPIINRLINCKKPFEM